MPDNSGKEWTADEIQQLREEAISSIAHSEGISLQPPNRPPYGDMS